MKLPRAPTRLLLVCVIAGLMTFACAGILLQRQSLAALKELSNENLPWSVTQVEIELHRFLSSLARFGGGDADVTAQDVNKRFDILWSRVSLYDSGLVGARLNAYDREIGAIRALRASLREHDETVVAVERGRQAAIYALQIAFGYHDARLHQLSGFVNNREERRRTLLRERLENAQLAVGGLSILAIFMSALLALVVLLEARRHRREAEESAAMAARAQAANIAKSRFLSMMSHELRTPMNGVLGQLALAKAQGLAPAALRLLERAEASGLRLLSMLIDILDFSALQENQLDIRRRPFDLVELADNLRAGDPGQAEIAVECAERLPRRVIADCARIRQAAAHLAGHVTETAAARNARLLIDHRDGVLMLTLSFLYDRETGEDWRPTRLLGEDPGADGAEDLRADALGPVIARALTDAMGGRLELTELYQGQTAVTMFIPAPVAVDAPPLVRIETRSQTMKMICEAALRGAAVDLAPPDAAPERVDFALLEAGGDDETESVRRLKCAYPAARLIAIGAPESPEDFDSVTPLPLEVNALASTLRMKTA